MREEMPGSVEVSKRGKITKEVIREENLDILGISKRDII